MPLPAFPFGNTGLQLPRLGLGLAALGRPGYINIGHADDLANTYVQEAMERRTHRLLDLAWREGIRYFDAARSYGRAEDFLLSWLTEKQARPDSIVVSSKWGYTYTADWQVDAEVHEVKEHSRAKLDEQWEQSRALLPFLKLYQIHSATLESGVLENAAVLNRLAELKANGIRIGFSVSGPGQARVIERGMAIELDGQRLFDSVQATFNLLERSSGPILEQAAAEGLAVVIKEALANGRLSPRNREPDFAPKKLALQEMADRYHCGVDALALAFVLAHPWVHLALSGAATERHLESNLKSLKLLKHIEPGELAGLPQLEEPPETYWAKRAALAWN